MNPVRARLLRFLCVTRAFTIGSQTVKGGTPTACEIGRREILQDPHSFFASVLTAGAILSGFCGTFLAFRIQRESNYYRQPALSFEKRKAVDIYIGVTHFTSPFLLLILATLCAIIFGFVLPLFAIADWQWILSRPEIVIAGLIAALIFLLAYFLDELVHYEILHRRLEHFLSGVNRRGFP